MAFIKTRRIEVGDWIVLTKNIYVYGGVFETGSKVKITNEGERGYDIEDADGNRANEVGFEIGTLI